MVDEHSQEAPLVQVGLNAVQMRHTRLVECSIRANEAFGPVQVGVPSTPAGVNIQHQSGFGSLENATNAFIGRLTIEVKDAPENEPQPPYFIKVVVEGFFEVPLENMPANVLQLVAINGTASMTAVARELVSTITARGMNGQFMIPSLTVSKPKAAAEVEEKSRSK